nr:MAG TPA: hypothetical protein [Caudoviricetes sp.]
MISIDKWYYSHGILGVISIISRTAPTLCRAFFVYSSV